MICNAEYDVNANKNFLQIFRTTLVQGELKVCFTNRAR